MVMENAIVNIGGYLTGDLTEYFRASAVSGIVMSFIGAIALLIVICCMISVANRVFYGTKSNQYRKYIADLYVAGKIRTYANEDKVDLETEKISFLKWCKESKIKSQKDFDDKIEEELNAKIDKKLEYDDELRHKKS